MKTTTDHAPGVRRTGVLTHGAITALIAGAWLLAGPGDGSSQGHLAELLGVEAVWLLSSSVLALTRSGRVERSFGGVEGLLLWHRLAGALGVGLGLLHPMLLVSDAGQPSVFAGLLRPLTVVAVLLVAWAFMTPGSRPAAWRGPLGALARTGYDRWRAMHGVLAVFLLAAMVHGLIDSASLRTSPVLLVLYVGVCVAGLCAVGERLVIARLGVRAVQGDVVAVDRSDARTAVISIRPARPVTHEAGQFVELGAPVSGERPHPFTVTSAPGAPHVQVAVRASGAGTHGIVQKVAVGDRVTLGAARGLFRHPDVGPRQVWVAGGIGIAPFVSWVRAQGERHPGHEVDLLWSDRGFEGAPFVAELRAAAQRFDWLRLHLHDTTRSARLTAADVVSVGGGDVDAITVLACGAPAMVTTLAAGLREAGLPRARLRSEAYSYR